MWVSTVNNFEHFVQQVAYIQGASAGHQICFVELKICISTCNSGRNSEAMLHNLVNELLTHPVHQTAYVYFASLSATIQDKEGLVR